MHAKISTWSIPAYWSNFPRSCVVRCAGHGAQLMRLRAHNCRMLVKYWSNTAVITGQCRQAGGGSGPTSPRPLRNHNRPQAMCKRAAFGHFEQRLASV